MAEFASSSSEDEVDIDDPKDKSFQPESHCKHCQEFFLLDSDLQKHIREEHLDKLTCDECNKKFASESNLMRHRLLHEKSQGNDKETGNKSNAPKEKCPTCNKLVHNLETHTRAKHTQEAKPFQCQHCAVSFASSGNLKIHIRRIHEKKYTCVCRYCGKGFFDKSKLKLHEMKHTGDRPFSCKICDKKFFCENYLKKHAVVHLQTKDFSCDKCGKKFKRERDVSYHKKFRHSNEGRNFKCVMCERTFLKNSFLKRHILSHTNEKSFECDVCKKLFLLKHSLKCHVKKHATTEPSSFVCDICGKCYKEKNNLFRHSLMAHKDSGRYIICELCDKACRNSNSLIEHKLKYHADLFNKTQN